MLVLCVGNSLAAAELINVDFKLLVQPVHVPLTDPQCLPTEDCWNLSTGVQRTDTPPRDENPGYLVTAFALRLSRTASLSSHWPDAASNAWWRRTCASVFFEFGLVGGNSEDHETHLDGSAWNTGVDFGTVVLGGATPERPVLTWLYGGGLGANILTAYEPLPHAYLFNKFIWIETGWQARLTPLSFLHIDPYAMVRGGLIQIELNHGLFSETLRATHGWFLVYGGVAMQWSWDPEQPQNGLALDLSAGIANSPRSVLSAALQLRWAA
ncbi:MAG TPA: hypothetical protein VL860_05865 [Planctomycetota bacterium]|nr:hypothetical protein [Planctomycetota bacterium]